MSSHSLMFSSLLLVLSHDMWRHCVFDLWFVPFLYIFTVSQVLCVILKKGLVETDPEGALAGFAEVVAMEPEKAEW